MRLVATLLATLLVATAAHAQMPGDCAPGTAEGVLDGAGLAPGVYLLRFEAVGEQRIFPVVKLR